MSFFALFSRKVSKFASSSLIFGVLTFKFISFHYLKRRQTSLSNSESLKVTKNLVDF